MSLYMLGLVPRPSSSISISVVDHPQDPFCILAIAILLPLPSSALTFPFYSIIGHRTWLLISMENIPQPSVGYYLHLSPRKLVNSHLLLLRWEAGHSSIRDGDSVHFHSAEEEEPISVAIANKEVPGQRSVIVRVDGEPVQKERPGLFVRERVR